MKLIRKAAPFRCGAGKGRNMITVRMIHYWNDDVKWEETKRFGNLGDLEDWIFNQMRVDYSRENGQFYLSFPKCGKNEDIHGISICPESGSHTTWIKQIADDGKGIIFSDGTFTAGQKHATAQVRYWLQECENRRRSPSFHFAPDDTGRPYSLQEKSVQESAVKRAAKRIPEGSGMGKMYDPKFWKRCRWSTVGQFCEYLRGCIPPDATVHVCGCNEFYTHLSMDGKEFSMDISPLSDLEEYEGFEPQDMETEEEQYEV